MSQQMQQQQRQRQMQHLQQQMEQLQQQMQQLELQQQQEQRQRPQDNWQQDPQDFMSLEQNLQRIPPVFLAQMQQEAGVSGRDISSLTFEEKVRTGGVVLQSLDLTFPPVALERSVQEDDGGVQRQRCDVQPGAERQVGLRC